MRIIPVGILVDPLLRLLDQVAPLPEDRRPLGARLGARGRLALRHEVRAEDALFHERRRVVVVEPRDVERARDHAVPAPHAAVFVVDGRPFGDFHHRLAQAGGSARRLGAVHALLPGEDRAVRGLFVRVLVDDEEGARRGVPHLLEHGLGREGFLRLRKLVVGCCTPPRTRGSRCTSSCRSGARRTRRPPSAALAPWASCVPATDLAA